MGMFAMTVVNSLDQLKDINDSVVTIGNFDGVHFGHQYLIKKAVEEAKNINTRSIAFTFSNHPVNYFNPNSIKQITTNEDKVKLIESLGIDIVLNITFNMDILGVSAEEYVKNILVDKLKVRKIVIGHDFTFAKNKQGNVQVLKNLSKKYNFDVIVVPPIEVDNIRVSSTYIRNLIQNGEVYKIERFLGRTYSVCGEVVPCRQLGRTIGFPTANTNISKDIMLPKVGIYRTKIKIGNRYFDGATNVGHNPTVENKGFSVETFILDFDENIYNQTMCIYFIERIRDEEKFNSLDELKNQLKKDVDYVYSKRSLQEIAIMIE
jgi:riboflavin kinase / FMN adenylyltransferase